MENIKCRACECEGVRLYAKLSQSEHPIYIYIHCKNCDYTISSIDIYNFLEMERRNVKVYEIEVLENKGENGVIVKIDHEIEFDPINGGKRLSYDRVMKVMEYVEDMMKKGAK